ncbi:MAG: tetratricopeptide repeat protein [Bacteroidales bacterium]
MKGILLLIGMIVWMAPGFSQAEKRYIREGNREFKAGKFSESEVAYRKALEYKNLNNLSGFNLGSSLYRQEKFEEAARQYEVSAGRDPGRDHSARALHNQGNAQLMAGNLDQSIEAYKEALRKNPGDLETKYNLAYALHLKKQSEQQQQQQPQDGEQDDQRDQDQQQKEPQQGQDDQQQQQQLQPQEARISREDARRLLEALANDEKKVQEKVKREQAKASRVRTLKDW